MEKREKWGNVESYRGLENTSSLEMEHLDHVVDVDVARESELID